MFNEPQDLKRLLWFMQVLSTLSWSKGAPSYPDTYNLHTTSVKSCRRILMVVPKQKDKAVSEKAQTIALKSWERSYRYGFYIPVLQIPSFG